MFNAKSDFIVRFSGHSSERHQEPEVLTFKEMLKTRRDQASKSILIQVDARRSCNDLHEYLSSLGEVRIMYHYVNQKNSHYALVEMADHEQASDIIHLANKSKTGMLTIGQSGVPYFKTRRIRIRLRNNKELDDDKVLEASPYKVPSTSILDKNDGTSLSLKMVQLYLQSTINDLGYRLRFLTCLQVEAILKTLDPSIVVLPFGSSVNGFGNKSGDLDMVALRDYDYSNENEMEWSRDTEQALIASAYDLIKRKLPGSEKAAKIPKAKVPLVKYYQKHTSLECDLSFDRRDSIIMSELLYFLSSVDARVKPLVFSVRDWAKRMELTSEHPGAWISNFSLTLLVLFFLQREHDENSSIMLPAWDNFFLERKNLLSNEVYTRLFNKYNEMALKNKLILEELLFKFFIFFSDFNFKTEGISVRSGEIVKKLGLGTALYIENPLSPDLNVSANVTLKEVYRIQNSMRNSVEALNSGRTGYQFSVLQPVPIKKRRKKGNKLKL